MSAQKRVVVWHQCLPLERMTSEYLVVTPMDVRVCVRQELRRMVSVTLLITKAIIFIDLVRLVSNNFRRFIVDTNSNSVK